VSLSLCLCPSSAGLCVSPIGDDLCAELCSSLGDSKYLLSRRGCREAARNENHSHLDSHSHLGIKEKGTFVPFPLPYLTASNSVARSLAFAFTRESHVIPRADSICRTTVAFLTTGSDALRSSLM